MSKKICFVSLASYPLLVNKNLGYIGGAEVDQVLLARELEKHGFNVSFVTYSESNCDRGGMESVNGIRIIKTYCQDDASTLNILSQARFRWRAMREANADIYFEAGASAIVALFCYLKRRKFVYCIASDVYVAKRNLGDIASKFIKFITKIGIHLNATIASAIVAQNEFQAKMLKQNFGKRCVIIPPAYPLVAQVLEKALPPTMLWVGTIITVKQPEVFLRLAESIPEANFQMIGGSHGDPELYSRTKGSAAKIPNLEFLGFIPFNEIDQYFERASIFVNTSSLEGFPATFVQAWAASTPVISLNVDPSEIICKNKLGFHSKTFDQMIHDVKLLLKDKKLRSEMGRNARVYMERKHDIKVITAKYLEVFKRVAAK